MTNDCGEKGARICHAQVYDILCCNANSGVEIETQETFLYDVKIITSNCSMKKEANGTYPSRINSRVYEQLEWLYYNAENIAIPVTIYISISMFMVLTLMDLWIAKVFYMKGLFLHGEFGEW